LIPPYENTETLQKLATDIAASDPRTVICLGDSFDDLASVDALDDSHRATLAQLQAGRRWIWIEGNHDPGPVPAYGAYTGGLSAQHPDLRKLFGAQAIAVLTGHKALPVPLKP